MKECELELWVCSWEPVGLETLQLVTGAPGFLEVVSGPQPGSHGCSQGRLPWRHEEAKELVWVFVPHQRANEKQKMLCKQQTAKAQSCESQPCCLELTGAQAIVTALLVRWEPAWGGSTAVGKASAIAAWMRQGSAGSAASRAQPVQVQRMQSTAQHCCQLPGAASVPLPLPGVLERPCWGLASWHCHFHSLEEELV